MTESVQVCVYDREQLVYAEDFAGVVEMGRQRYGREPLYSSRRENGHWRAVLARLDEATVSREHARVEPLPDGWVRIKNLSAKVQIRLPDGRELSPGATCELAIPAVLALGQKMVRLQSSAQATNQPGASLRSLAEATAPPGLLLPWDSARFATRSLSNPAFAAQLEEVVRWLRAAMDVLQCASSSDFFQKAAQAVVDIVGLDRGRVLLRGPGPRAFSAHSAEVFGWAGVWPVAGPLDCRAGHPGAGEPSETTAAD
jgi:hypothetical protein